MAQAHTSAQKSLALTEMMRRINLGQLPLRIVDWDDRSTWEIEFDGSETQEQRDAAQTIINTFDINAYLAVEEQRRAGIRNDAGARDLFDRIRSKSSAEIDQWLANNVTTLAEARKVLGAIIKTLAARM